MDTGSNPSPPHSLSRTYLQKKIFINSQIRAKEIRLIDETGKQIGVLELGKALEIAKEKGLDLIQITEKVEPPVCKLGEYGKYLYQLEKKARKLKKHEGGGLKEIRLTFNISPNDIATRAQQAEKFLKKGDRVKVVLPLRGRQKSLEGYARERVERFLQTLRATFPIAVERELKREPRGLTMTIMKG